MKTKVSIIGDLFEVMFVVEFNDNILSYLSTKMDRNEFEGNRFEMNIKTFLAVIEDMRE